MKQVPQSASESVRRRNPHLYGPTDEVWMHLHGHPVKVAPPTPQTKPLLNKTEARWKAVLVGRGAWNIMEQALTLRLDPPFRSYKADLAYVGQFGLTLVEVKGPHRFRRAGIAKVALAAKTYPQFRFELADWTGKEWKESVLSP